MARRDGFDWSRFSYHVQQLVVGKRSAVRIGTTYKRIKNNGGKENGKKSKRFEFA